MLLGEYQFRAIFADEARLPAFKGSTFRGVFGRALKAVVCALKRQECPDCLLRQQCVYTRVFQHVAAPGEEGRPSPPHPFVISPPLTSRTIFAQGEPFDFTLLLFGEANQYLPYFVYAFEQMGQIGLGRGQEGRRAGFNLVEVRSSAGVIYRGEDRCLTGGKESLRELTVTPSCTAPGATTRLTVTLLTPLRLKFDNRLHAELPFHVLIRAALRRVSSLFTQFGAGEPRLDYKGLVARAQAVRTTASTICWFDWQRYSHRQDQAMLLGGMVGEATYEGEVGEFMPLLRLVEIVHLGKATTFGLGKVKVSGER
jgi:hypothetical protein